MIIVNIPAGKKGIANLNTVLSVIGWMVLKLTRFIMTGNERINTILDAVRFAKRTPVMPILRITTKKILNPIVERTFVKLKAIKGMGFSSARNSRTGRFQSASRSNTPDSTAIHSGLSTPKTIFAILFLEKKSIQEKIILLITCKP